MGKCMKIINYSIKNFKIFWQKIKFNDLASGMLTFLFHNQYLWHFLLFLGLFLHWQDIQNTLNIFTIIAYLFTAFEHERLTETVCAISLINVPAVTSKFLPSNPIFVLIE